MADYIKVMETVQPNWEQSAKLWISIKNKEICSLMLNFQLDLLYIIQILIEISILSTHYRE